MCFPKRKLKRTSKKMRFHKPENKLFGCKMIILIDEPYNKFYRSEYCNGKISEGGFCDVHKELNFIEK